MHGIGLLLGTAQAVQQQQLVDGIHQRVDALAEHRRAARQPGGDELGDGDAQVAGKRGIDDKTGAGRLGHGGKGLEGGGT